MHQGTVSAPGRSSRLQFIDVLERLKASGELKAIQESYSSQQDAQASVSSATGSHSRPSYASAAGGSAVQSRETFGRKLSTGALIMQHPQTPPRKPRGRGRARSRGGGRAGSRSLAPGSQVYPPTQPLVPSSVTVAAAGGRPAAMNIADFMDDHVAAFNSFMAQFQPPQMPHADGSGQSPVDSPETSPLRGEPAASLALNMSAESRADGTTIELPADGDGERTSSHGAPDRSPSSGGGITTPPRQHGSLLSKLNSPDRLRVDSETTAARTAARHAQAEANRAKLEQQRQARLRQKANKVREVSERAAAMRSKRQYTQAELRLNAASQRHTEHLANIKQRALSENRKVQEVEFINSMTREDKIARMVASARQAEARRQAAVEKVRTKAGGVASRASQVAGATAAAAVQQAAQRTQAMEERLTQGAERRAMALQERASRASSDVGRGGTPPGRKVYGVDGQSQLTSYEKSPPRLGKGSGSKQGQHASARSGMPSYAAAVSSSGGGTSAGSTSAKRTASKQAADAAPPSALVGKAPAAPASAPSLPPPVKRVHRGGPQEGGAAAGAREAHAGQSGHTAPKHHELPALDTQSEPPSKHKGGVPKRDSWSGVSSAVTSLVLTGSLASPTPERGSSISASAGVSESKSSSTPPGTHGSTDAKAPKPVPSRPRRKSKTAAAASKPVDELNLQDLDLLLSKVAPAAPSPTARGAAGCGDPLAMFHLSGLGLRPDATPQQVQQATAAQKARLKRARKTRAAIFGAVPPAKADRPPKSGPRPRIAKLLSAVTTSIVLDSGDSSAAQAQSSPLMNLACPLPTALPSSMASLLQALDASGAYCEATATLPESVLGATFALQQAFDASDDGVVASEFNHLQEGGAAGMDETGDGGSAAVSLRMTSTEAAYLRTSGALHVAASVCTARHMKAQPGLLVPALRLLLLGCALPDNCDYLLAHGLMVPVVDVLAAALDSLPLRDMGLLAHMHPDSVSDSLLQALGHDGPILRESSLEEAPSVDAVARSSEGIAITMASLQVLWLLFRHAAQRPESDQETGQALTAQVQRLVQYMVHSSVLLRLATLVDLLRDAPTLVAFSPLLRTVLAFFVALLNAHPRQLKPVASGGSLTAAGDVLCKQVMSTGCLGIPSLLVALLLAVSPRSRTRNHSRQRDGNVASPRSGGTPKAAGSGGMHGHRRSSSGGAGGAQSPDAVSSIPQSALATAVLALKVSNAACRLDVRAMQGLLEDPALRSSVFHALEHLLSHAAHGMGHEAAGARIMDTTEEAVWETTLLVGYLCHNNATHAQLLRWGPPPTPLQRLATLPFRYFSQHPYTAVLLPTLVTACAADSANLAIVAQHCSPELLLSFLDALAEGKQGSAAGTSVVHASGVKLAPFAGMPAAVSEPLLQALLPPLPPVYQPWRRLDLRPAALKALRTALQTTSHEADVGFGAASQKSAPDFDAMD